MRMARSLLLVPANTMTRTIDRKDTLPETPVARGTAPEGTPTAAELLDRATLAVLQGRALEARALLEHCLELCPGNERARRMLSGLPRAS